MLLLPLDLPPWNTQPCSELHRLSRADTGSIYIDRVYKARQKVSASPQTVHAKSVLQEGSVAACLPFLGHLHIRTFLHDNDKSLLHAWGTRIQSKGIMISPLVWSLVTLKIISEPQSALNVKTPQVGSKRAMKSCVLE